MPHCPNAARSAQLPTTFNEWRENEDMISFHLDWIHRQLQQAYVGMALAVASGRAFILPKVRLGPAAGAGRAPGGRKRASLGGNRAPCTAKCVTLRWPPLLRGPAVLAPGGGVFWRSVLRSGRAAATQVRPSPTSSRRRCRAASRHTQFQCWCEKIWYPVVRCRVVSSQDMPLPVTW